MHSRRSLSSRLVIFVLLFGALLVGVGPVAATHVEQGKGVAADAAMADWLGRSVAISGDTAVVGAPQHDAFGTNSGAAYVFVRTGSGWTQQAKLVPSDGASQDSFGIAVAISGDTIVVGAYGDEDFGSLSGSAYVFRRTLTTWNQEAKLTASDGAAGDFFGFSVGVSGDTVVVGAYGEDDNGIAAGAAYLFERSGATWTQSAKIVASDGGNTDFFGTSVAISVDTVIVGAPQDDDAGAQSGSAYIFTRSGGSWSEEAKLLASDGAADDRLGHAVSISGNTAVAGAYGHATNGAESGAVYVFERGGSVWGEQAKLTAPDSEPYDRFGKAVSISGNSIAVGVHSDDDLGGDAGAVYVFNRAGATWSEDSKLTASDGSAFDQLGWSVAVSGDTVVAGSYLEDSAASDAGAAYFFQPDSPWSSEAKLTASDGGFEDQFGASVAIDNDTAVVGTPYEDGSGTDVGAAYVYRRVGGVWSEEAKLVASDGETFDRFGIAVAISGDTVLVGAYLDDDRAGNAGAAYVFQRTGTTWVEQAKLTAADGGAQNSFGWSLDLEGDTALIGAYHNDAVAIRSGAAYVFQRSGSTWNMQAKLTASDGAAEDLLGESVSLSGDTAVLGAIRADAGATDSGAIYVFRRAGSIWSEEAKLSAADGATLDQFGISVAISVDTIIVGARRDDDGGRDSGSAYIFERTGAIWSQQDKITASNGSIEDFFGDAVGIAGSTAIVGAYNYSGSGTATGTVYVFRRTGTSWTREARLIAPDPAPADRFGWSVDIAGNTAIVGSPFDDDPALSAGAAYLFTSSTIDLVAEAGGLYSGAEGDAIQLDGSGSEPSGGGLSYAWGVDSPTCSFDSASSATPVLTCTDDGEYTVTLEVSDGATTATDTAAVSVANVAPTIVDIAVPLAPIDIGEQAGSTVDVTFSDPGADASYQCAFDLDQDGTTDTTVVASVGGACSAPLSYSEPGVYNVSVVVTDKDGGVGSAVATDYIVIYDPDGGFVTGGGWIDSPVGAYTANPTLTGKANFGFVSKYKKGASVPSGSTEFNFSIANLNFHSESYQWLVVNQGGTRAQYKGDGRINGEQAPGDVPYHFMLWATDDAVADTFRIKIWYEDSSGGKIVVYDNDIVSEDGSPLGGGKIKIH